MYRKILLLLVFILTSFISLPQISNAVTITDTISASMDNTLYEDEFGSLSNGLGTHFFTGKTGTGSIRRGLLLFSVENSIPVDAIITSVRLQLHMSMSAGTSGSRRIELHRALKYWGEGSSFADIGEGIGAPSEPNDATWIHSMYASEFWINPGGDFDSSSSGNTNVDAVGYYEWSTMGMINDVTYWINNSFYNNGWVLKGDENNSPTAKRFDTKDNPDSSLRPKLIVTYTTNSIGISLLALTEGYWRGTDGGSALPDTMRIYLRSASAPYAVVDSAKIYHAILSDFVFSAPSGSYYLVVKQRNSIDTWSKLPVSFTTGFVTSYSFISAATQAFGDNLILEAGLYAIYSGDINKDGFINLTDIVADYNDATNFVTGYSLTDLNGDNVVNLTDLLFVTNNSTNFVKVLRP